MGSHGLTSARLRTSKVSQHAREQEASRSRRRRPLDLRDWPVSWRLIAVIVMALIMGLVFGGLRVASAADSAAEFGRVTQLAQLGQQVTNLVQALENERDQTLGVVPTTDQQKAAVTLQPEYAATDQAAASVKQLAARVNGSFPANIQSRVATVVSEINDLPTLRGIARASQEALAAIAAYSPPIGNMIALNNQIDEGTADSGLVSDVQTLNALALTKDQASQQRALLFNALTQQLFADGELQAFTTAVTNQGADKNTFNATATPAEQQAFTTLVAGPGVNKAEQYENLVLGLQLPDLSSLGLTGTAASKAWFNAQSATVDDMQKLELQVAQSIVARSQTLQQGAQRSELITAILTIVILLLVVLATIAVALSLVRPLRRLRQGALGIATVQLPERVRLLGESADPTSSIEVAPIDVASADEIGQVARAFDQVHAEAVRLAGNEAMLRSSFNAMFVNLSRRSQLLIERLARMIDSLEQNEDDPGRLSNLFSMDHLVTRMRRNSENLLLLAGHESARKWSEAVPLADVVRAATSEIEQYSRVTQRTQPGVAVTGQAVTDVVHLLAEIIENATIFSPKDTPVHVSGQVLTTGGVLLEVSDNGVGIPDARLAEMNWRLDNPPVMDVSVSKHMGLFAVARLAERHGVRVRLLAGSPQGLTALVWLPDSVIEREAAPSAWPGTRFGRPAFGGNRKDGAPAPKAPAGLQAGGMQPPAGLQPATGPQPVTGPQVTIPQPKTAAGPSRTATSHWFRSQRDGAGAGGNGSGVAANGGGNGTAGNGTAGNGRAANGLPGNGTAGNGTPGFGHGQPGSEEEQFGAGWDEGKHAAEIVADPVHGKQTSAGLPLRVPRANLLPGSVRGAHRAGGPTRPPADARPDDAAAGSRPRRTPEMARNRLGGFQRGVRRAKGQPAHRAGEGADR
jgi:signal transduction histidine kinase